MRKLILVAMIGANVAQPAQAQGFGDFLRGILGNPSKPASQPESASKNGFSAISEAEARAGLKEALTIGTREVARQLSMKDGYFGDDLIRIPLPGKLSDVQKQLSRFGMAEPLDDLQLRMNRAAEDAAPLAADMVIDAIQSLTINDAVNLLQGGDTAATDLLRLKTENQLVQLLRPKIETALDDAGALRLAEDVTAKYDLSRFNIDPRKDLVDHAVEEALDGLFFYLAEQEQGIRNNPVERTTELLRKVFGG